MRKHHRTHAAAFTLTILLVCVGSAFAADPPITKDVVVYLDVSSTTTTPSSDASEHSYLYYFSTALKKHFEWCAAVGKARTLAFSDALGQTQSVSAGPQGESVSPA